MNLYLYGWLTTFYTRKDNGSRQSFIFYLIHNDSLSMTSVIITPFIINYSIGTFANTNNNMIEDDDGSNS